MDDTSSAAEQRSLEAQLDEARDLYNSGRPAGHLAAAIVHKARITGDFRALSRALLMLGVISFDFSQHTLAGQHLAEALSIAEQHGFQDLVTGCLHNLAAHQIAHGRLDQGEALLDQALGSARLCGDVGREGSVFYLRGHCSWERGQFGDAHDYWTAAADSYKLMGRTNLLLNALDLLCKADFEMARDLEYRQLIVEVERLGHECGNDRQVTQALLHRASQSVVLCDLPAAQECLDRANALISQLDQEVPKLSLSLDWARGDYLLAQQRPAEALECLTRAKRCAQDQRMRVTLATIRNDYGKALIALDRLEHASAVLLDAESVLELCSATPALAKTYALWARYWWKKGDPTAAAQALEEARALARHLPICGRTLERELEAAANLIGQ